jgi:hypothetical protein
VGVTRVRCGCRRDGHRGPRHRRVDDEHQVGRFVRGERGFDRLAVGDRWLGQPLAFERDPDRADVHHGRFRDRLRRFAVELREHDAVGHHGARGFGGKLGEPRAQLGRRVDARRIGCFLPRARGDRDDEDPSRHCTGA